MNSARHDLILLVRLQGLYDSIAETIRERREAPPEVRELEEQNKVRQQELDALQERISELMVKRRTATTREEEFKLELEHFQKQKAMVTNEREFTAVISEIDYATKGLQEANATRSGLETEIAELEAEIAQRSAARPEEEAAEQEVVGSWEARKEELKRTVHGLATAANEIEGQLNPVNRARFLRLLESKRGTAMAALADGSCSACHFAVRLHLQQRVRRCEELIFCESCRRILYSEDSLDTTVTD